MVFKYVIFPQIVIEFSKLAFNQEITILSYLQAWDYEVDFPN